MKHLLLWTCLMAGAIQTIYAQPANPWTVAEQELINADADSIPLRLFLVTNPEDSVLLRTPSAPINTIPSDPVLQHFIKRMYATVRDSASMGVGIAAPQVGLLRQIIWVQRFDKEGFPFEAYLNIKIRQYSKLTRMGPEGCLSIPDVRDSVSRAYAILIEYDRPDGSHVIEMVEDFTAVIFQHEIDHLNGIVFTDHVQQEIAEAKAREAAQANPSDAMDASTEVESKADRKARLKAERVARRAARKAAKQAQKGS
ncbi:MAG: peptide deformylase [Bacteroidota bacterium]